MGRYVLQHRPNGSRSMACSVAAMTPATATAFASASAAEGVGVSGMVWLGMVWLDSSFASRNGEANCFAFASFCFTLFASSCFAVPESVLLRLASPLATPPRLPAAARFACRSAISSAVFGCLGCCIPPYWASPARQQMRHLPSPKGSMRRCVSSSATSDFAFATVTFPATRRTLFRSNPPSKLSACVYISRPQFEPSSVKTPIAASPLRSSSTSSTSESE